MVLNICIPRFFLERMQRENEGGLFYIHFDCSRRISCRELLHLRNKLYVKYMYIHAVISFDTLRMFICKSAHSRRLVIHNLGMN